MKQLLETIKSAALEAIKNSSNLKETDEIRVKYLGKKGELTAILKQMGSLTPEERPKMGQLVNEAKALVEEQLANKNAELKDAEIAGKLKAETLDKIGRAHV